MTRMIVNTLGVAMVFCFGALALGQGQAPPGQQTQGRQGSKPAKTSSESSLENLLAQALKQNSDIRVAESKVREAEAQLEKARMEVMQKVLRVYQEIAAQRALTKLAQERFERAEQIHKRGAMSQEEFRAAQEQLQQAKALLAKAEAEMPFLVGSQRYRAVFNVAPDLQPFFMEFQPDQLQLWQGLEGRFQQNWQKADEQKKQAKAAGDMAQRAAMKNWLLYTGVKFDTAEKIRAALDTRVQGEFTVQKLLAFLEDNSKGLNVVNQATTGSEFRETIRFKEPIPLGAALQWLEDRCGWRFVIRDYGIVIATRERVPPGAPILHDLWKHDLWKKAPVEDFSTQKK